MTLAETTVTRAENLAARGDVAAAYALLRDAVARGDAEAAATLGDWRLSGQHIRRDLALARDHYGRAVALGLKDIAPVHIALLANGAGGSGRWWADALVRLRELAASDADARAQVAVIEAMGIDGEGEPTSVPAAIALRDAPRVATIPAFLTPAECAFLIARAAPRLQPSVVVDPATGRLIHDPVRTSSATAFPFVEEDLAIHAINRRIAAVTATTYAQGEPLQILRYVPGQHYKLHSDALPGEANPRALTLLVYLNDGYVGGETEFPDLGLRVRGAPGDALLFASVDAAGAPCPAARHAGLPVRSGEKFLLSKWIRAAALDLSGPLGRPF